MKPPPPGASVDEMRAYYESQSTPRQFTDEQRARIAARQCIDCGAPASMRFVGPDKPAAYYIDCQTCRLSKRARPVSRWQGSGASSVGREYHRRLGYGRGEGQ